VIETLLSGLIAPVMMIFQSTAVGEILLGRDAGWQVQRRDDGQLPSRELIRKYALPTVFGIIMAASAYAVSLPLLLWMTPVIIGLLLSIPIAMLSSRLSRPNSRLFRTPEESAPPQVLVRANELARAADEEMAVAPLQTLRDDRQLLDKHLANLPVDQRRNRGQIDPHLAIARAKIEDAQTFEEAVSYLTPRETFAVLNSPNLLKLVCAMPRAPERQGSSER
jgi:membrane glycosyltransferase